MQGIDRLRKKSRDDESNPENRPSQSNPENRPSRPSEAAKNIKPSRLQRRERVRCYVIETTDARGGTRGTPASVVPVDDAFATRTARIREARVGS